MERYSLILITDETAPIRRFDLRRDLFRRAVAGAAVAACLLAVGFVDYVRVRGQHGEIPGLRAENAEQRQQIERFGASLTAVEADLARLRELERKVRIIANLPGSAGTGGETVTAVGASQGGDLDDAAASSVVNPNVPETPDSEAAPDAAEVTQPDATVAPVGQRVDALHEDAARLASLAALREESLADLVAGLESKRQRLDSTPAIWPAKGWLTSRFGNRVSPFTGSHQFHGGIDIAGARGTDIIAPARGRVSFVGNRGPLGKSLSIDHGHGVRTIYGHNDAVHVKRGAEVERGQVIASLGSSGRSTGPHVHYVVEVNGKAVNPLNYIFD